MVAYPEGNESERMNFQCVVFKNLLLRITKNFSIILMTFKSLDFLLIWGFLENLWWRMKFSKQLDVSFYYKFW